MSLETSLTAFVNAVGADIKNGQLKVGDLAALTTAQKASVVLALNELKTDLTTLQGQIAAATNINDAGLATSTTETYSISKIIDSINTASQNLKQEILGSAPAALDTLQELATALSDNPSFATDIATALGNRVRYDEAQALTGTQQEQARTNIAAASAQELTQLKSDLGDLTTDYLTLYNTAKA